jgi:hypothetical protein
MAVVIMVINFILILGISRIECSKVFNTVR